MIENIKTRIQRIKTRPFRTIPLQEVGVRGEVVTCIQHVRPLKWKWSAAGPTVKMHGFRTSRQKCLIRLEEVLVQDLPAWTKP